SDGIDLSPRVTLGVQDEALSTRCCGDWHPRECCCPRRMPARGTLLSTAEARRTGCAEQRHNHPPQGRTEALADCHRRARRSGCATNNLQTAIGCRDDISGEKEAARDYVGRRKTPPEGESERSQREAA